METGKRVVIADAGVEFRGILAQALAGEPDLQVVGETGDGAELVRMVRQLRPDAVVMEMVLTGMDENQCYLADPMQGDSCIERDRFESIYTAMGSRAVVLR